MAPVSEDDVRILGPPLWGNECLLEQGEIDERILEMRPGRCRARATPCVGEGQLATRCDVLVWRAGQAGMELLGRPLRHRLVTAAAASLVLVAANRSISCAVTGVDGPWNIPLNSSLNVARGCVRKSIWLPYVTT